MNKTILRKQLRAIRRDHVAALDPATRALIMHRPPAPLMALVPEGATIGLYHATAHEAPAVGYAKFFHERGHPLALPRFAHRSAGMEFAAFADPWDEGGCEIGPFGLLQPGEDAQTLVPTSCSYRCSALPMWARGSAKAADTMTAGWRRTREHSRSASPGTRSVWPTCLSRHTTALSTRW